MRRILFWWPQKGYHWAICRTLCCKFFFLFFTFHFQSCSSYCCFPPWEGGQEDLWLLSQTHVYDLPEPVLVLLLSNSPQNCGSFENPSELKATQASCLWQLHPGRTSSFITMVLGVLSWALFSSVPPQVSSFFLPSFLSSSLPSSLCLPFFLFWLRCLHPKSNFPKPFMFHQPWLLLSAVVTGNWVVGTRLWWKKDE